MDLSTPMPGLSSNNKTTDAVHSPQGSIQLPNGPKLVVANEQVVHSPTSGNRKRIITFVNTNFQGDVKKPKINMPKNKKNKKNKDFTVTSGTNSPRSTVSESDEESRESVSLDPILDQDTPIEGSPFEIEVKTSLRLLTRAFFGNKKTKTAGLVRRVEDVEEELYGGDTPSKGLTTRVLELEKAQSTPTSTSTEVRATNVAALQDTIKTLEAHNAFLSGATARLQASNKSLQNELYVQKDRQTFLNLHLGGVSVLENKTPKEEAAAFFHDVLELPNVKATAFVKAYRKSGPKEFDKNVKLDSGATKKLHVSAPGVMFVCLESEILREQAMAKAHGLGGKRHPEANHKYFVSSVVCEATRATRNRHRTKLQQVYSDNKNKPDGHKTDVYIRGDSLVIGGQLHHDFIEPPSVAQVDTALSKEHDAIQALQLYQSTAPVIENSNQFTAYAVHTRTMDKVRLGYIKTFATQPSAAHVVMAYRIGKHSGSCDDGEFKAGSVLLKLIKSKNLKNVALYITRVTNGQRLGQKRF